MISSSFRVLCAAVTLSLCASCVSSAAPTTPALWPPTFTAHFVTNVSWSASASASTPLHAVAQYDASDAARPLLRVDHAGGAVECVKFYNVTTPCSLVFTPTGMYRFLADPPSGTPPCCLDIPGVGAPPRDWAVVSNATYEGVFLDSFSGTKGPVWEWDPPSSASPGPNPQQCHTLMQTNMSSNALPVFFTFPAADGRQDWHFDVASFRFDTPNSAAFAIPPTCTNTRCPK